MRIGLIKRRFVSFGGGSERYYGDLVEQLRQRGHEIHVFASQWDAGAEAGPLVWHRVPLVGGGSFLGQLSFALACRKAVEREPCEIIFSAERTLRQDVCRAGGGCHREWLRRRARYASPLRRLSFRLNPLHRTLLWLEARMYSPENTRWIIANSQRGKEEIIRLYGYPADRIEVIHNGVDGERFRPAPGRDGAKDFILLSVGSGFERKGLRFCIEALAKLPPHVRLVVAGKGKRLAYERLAERLGVASRVEFLGATPDMRAVYAQGDLLVHPAIYEPFSNACLEAMACGLPVVTSRINGAAELIVPGNNGAVVEDPGVTETLAGAIRPFLDRNFLRPAAARARLTAEAHPISLNVERTLELFERVRADILPGRPRGRP